VDAAIGLLLDVLEERCAVAEGGVPPVLDGEHVAAAIDSVLSGGAA
jgi:hypothetical protein